MRSDQKLERLFHNTVGTHLYKRLDRDVCLGFLDAALVSGFSLSESAAYLRAHDLRAVASEKVSGRLQSALNYNDPVRSALSKLSERPDLLDAVMEYVLADKHIVNHKFFQAAYYSAPRSLLRKHDGSFRSAEEMALTKSCKIAVEVLVRCAIRHRDSEAIEHLRKFPAARYLDADQFIEKIIRSHHLHKDYGDIEACFERYLAKTPLADMTLQAYWAHLIEKEAFDTKTPLSSLADFYQPTLTIKCPEAFVVEILKLSKWYITKGNHFILLMIRDGLDCYPGFVSGTEGLLASFDKSSARDYQGMINVCLKRKHLTGYLALLSGVPIDEIKRHGRKVEALNLIHQLTGSVEAIKSMDTRQRGKALERDLAL